MPHTPLDRASAAMSPVAGEAARRRFYECVADTELQVLLDDEEPVDGRIAPRVFETSDGRFAVGFDLAERLAAFVSEPTPTLGIPGRTLAAMLADRGIGLGLNLGVAPSSSLLPPEVLQWIAGMTAARSFRCREKVRRFERADNASDVLRSALTAKLNTIPGVAGLAFLVTAIYRDDRRALALALYDVPPMLQENVAGAVADAAAFSGDSETVPDVIFLVSGSSDADYIRNIGDPLKLCLPDPPKPSRSGPGLDPRRPPILR